MHGGALARPLLYKLACGASRTRRDAMATGPWRVTLEGGAWGKEDSSACCNVVRTERAASSIKQVGRCTGGLQQRAHPSRNAGRS